MPMPMPDEGESETTPEPRGMKEGSKREEASDRGVPRVTVHNPAPKAHYDKMNGGC